VRAAHEELTARRVRWQWLLLLVAGLLTVGHGLMVGG
jgi:hypothetical protein